MTQTPVRKPLHLRTNRELRDMAIGAAENVIYSLADISGEMRYREQRRIAKWVAVLVTGTLATNVIAIILDVIY